MTGAATSSASAASAGAPPDIAARIAALGPWFHNLELGGIETAPDHPLGDHPRAKFARFSAVLPARLDGLSVLDIGCNGGFYALEMKRRGAARVLAIDHDADYLAQARFAAEVSGLDIEFAEADVYDLAALGGPFDIVLFLGVLYHLRHPLLALDLIRAHAAKDLLVVQSLITDEREEATPAPDYPFAEKSALTAPGWPKLHFIEHAFAGDPTNWWAPNRAGLRAMLRAAGFTPHETPERDVFLCRPTP